jgi:argininosuccinate lyase
VNVIYAQMNRGKMERNVSTAISSLASTLSKLAMDICLYSNQDFGFVTLPEAFTTGSSIMPHKKNPDIFELIRAKCNKISALPYQISLITTNLPSGYHRDMQMIKEDFVYMFGEINACIEMATLALKDIKVKDNILDNPKYLYLFSVETVNQYVLQGMPFRDAYIKVGQEIASGNYQKPELVNHTHIGSVGNLSLDRINSMMKEVYESFDFSYNEALKNLLKK